MISQKRQQRITQGDGQPASLQEYALRLADRMFEVEELQIQAIERMAQEFPPIYELVRYAPGWGWSGQAPKEWTRFCREVYPTYIMVAELFYERFVTKQLEAIPNYGRPQDLEHQGHPPGTLWAFMGDHFLAIREEVVAKFYEILPKLKSKLDIDTKSEERQAFYAAISNTKGPGVETLSQLKQRKGERDYDED